VYFYVKEKKDKTVFFMIAFPVDNHSH
jgi:hypothetical protein